MLRIHGYLMLYAKTNNKMEYLEIALKLIVGLSVLNVWLIRSNRATQWRGGNAGNMKEEFATYGLSENFMKAIGALKVGLSLLLIGSIWYKPLELIAAGGIAFLMFGAVLMHIKVKDPLMKSLPAATFLVLSSMIIVL
jgi:hypothetical protein